MFESVSEVLESAADLIEKKGWLQGGLGDETVGYCAVGAIVRAKNKHVPSVLSTPEVRALRDYLGVVCVPGWNDEQGRTKQEVLDALRGAAKQERIKEEGLL